MELERAGPGGNSRLNYARKAIKIGVEDYEKKGTKLYSISILPFLLYFLREDASACHISAEALQKLAKSAVSAAAGSGGAAASGTDTVSLSDASEVETTPDPVNGAVSSASRKNKGASIAVRGSSFGIK